MTLASVDLLTMSIDEVNKHYGKKSVSPLEVAQTHLRQLTRVDPVLDAFQWVDEERFVNLARESEVRTLNEKRLGPLDGVVVSIKDTEDIQGAPTTFGSRFHETDVANRNGLVTERLLQAGALVIGKTTMPQFGYKDMGDNLLGKQCVNPWDRRLTSGGSSAGAAASLAGGIGHVAHGNDGGGSVRIPAAFCGLVGLKPSFGRIAFEPGNDRFALRSHQGVLARSIRDAALLLEALSGPDSIDPFAIDNEWTAPPLADGVVQGLRVGWIDASIAGYGVDPIIRDGVESACATLSSLGCHVEEAAVTWSDAPRVFSTLYTVSKGYELRSVLAKTPEWIEPTLAALIETGLGMAPSDIADAMRLRTEVYASINNLFDRFDALIMPTTQSLPWSAEPGLDEGPGPIDGVGEGTLLERLAYTSPFNITGHPAMAVPCGLAPNGLPLSVQIVGPWHADGEVLRLARAFEGAAPWADWYRSLAEGVDRR